MDIWIRIPQLRNFSIENVTAQTIIKSEEVGFLSLNKEQSAQIIGTNENWVWAIDEATTEGWVPKCSSKISTIVIPHLGADFDFKVTLTIKNQMQKFCFHQDLENYLSDDSAAFHQVDWDDKLFIVLEANHHVIGSYKITLSEFQTASVKFIKLDLKNFKRSSATLIMQITQNESIDLSAGSQEAIMTEGGISLISGEILRYTCTASASSGQVFQTGKLSITNYRFLFTSGSTYDRLISVPLNTIDSFNINIGQLTIITKDLRTIDYFISQEYMRYVLDKYSELKGLHFCFDYHLAFNSSNDFGWSIYDPEREFTRMGAFDNGLFQKSDINNDYKFCETYPLILFQPSCITNEELAIVAGFRSRRRVPTLTWVGKTAGLFRSSQPCVGVFYARCKEDEEYMAKAGIKFIVDARPKVSARANKVKGKGFEHSAYYTTCKMHFMNIQNIHKVRTSYEALKGITTRDDYFLQLHNSKWMSHLRSVLFAAKVVSDFIIYQRASVLVHCSDGWDRTSQISALAQILIDPFYRSFHGFQVLICKDWLSFGHKFEERTSSTSEGSPIFIQFLDAVFQVMRQFPNEFQFTNAYLLFLADAVYSGKYGTFMANCEKELGRLSDKTVSVWKEESSEFFNPLYSPSGVDSLFISTQISNLVLWNYFYQWNIS